MQVSDSHLDLGQDSSGVGLPTVGAAAAGYEAGWQVAAVLPYWAVMKGNVDGCMRK